MAFLPEESARSRGYRREMERSGHVTERIAPTFVARVDKLDQNGSRRLRSTADQQSVALIDRRESLHVQVQTRNNMDSLAYEPNQKSGTSRACSLNFTIVARIIFPIQRLQ